MKPKQFELPYREGTRPRTTNRTPHTQLDQNSSPEILEKLTEWAFSLEARIEEPSRISVPGARALVLQEDVKSDEEAFMIGREFAHIHPQPSGGSMHLKLRPDHVAEVIKKGWGENHFLVDAGTLPVGAVLIYAPRNDEDLEVIKIIILQSYQYAQAEL